MNVYPPAGIMYISDPPVRACADSTSGSSDMLVGASGRWSAFERGMAASGSNAVLPACSARGAAVHARAASRRRVAGGGHCIGVPAPTICSRSMTCSAVGCGPMTRAPTISGRPMRGRCAAGSMSRSTRCPASSRS